MWGMAWIVTLVLKQKIVQRTYGGLVTLALVAISFVQLLDNEFYILISGEVAKLFADAGVICIASLISPYKRDRDACRALLPDGDFIEVGASHVYGCSWTLSQKFYSSYFL